MTRTRTRATIGGVSSLLLAIAAALSPVAVTAADAPASRLTGATAIAAGAAHTCALVHGGRVRCWGSNSQGELGDGTTVNRPAAVEVEGITGATAIAAGWNTTCALVGGGEVRCWGWNGNGELQGAAAGDEEPPWTVPLPMEVTELRGAAAILIRGDNPCAVMPGGVVRCRQHDPNISIRLGSDEPRPTPRAMDVATVADGAAVVAGEGHMCAFEGDGSVGCWGWIRYGSLGDGRTEESETPVAVHGVQGATALAAGGGRACAVVEGGRVTCWGRTGWDPLTGDAVIDLWPVLVEGVEGATALSTRDGHACAVVAEGRVRCWGPNGQGELGDGTRQDSSSGIEVAGLTDAVSVAVGTEHSCALTAAGEVRCWGSNRMGERGDGGVPASSREPVAVTDLTDAVALASGDRHTCALSADGGISCWGGNEVGELGDGTLTNQGEPVRVAGVTDATAIAAGSQHTCAVVADGRVRCWGRDASSSRDGAWLDADGSASEVPGIRGATAVAAHDGDTCALIDDGSVRCWGRDWAWAEPVSLPGIDDAVSLVAGTSHACALVGGGRVRCWGAGGMGQLGTSVIDGARTVAVPIEVPDLEGVTALAAGSEHTCALTVDTHVRCWGRGAPGGTDEQAIDPVPVEVAGVEGAVAIAAHGSDTCALLASGALRCWGSNDAGQLGDGTTLPRVDPVDVLGVTGASAVTMGGSHACAAVAEGAVRCWGANDVGQLGDGSPATSLGFVLIDD